MLPMSDNTRKYTKDNITVLWQPDKCIHSTKCWRNLPQVFNPKSRPWVSLDGAESQAIIDQVAACPSGALSIEQTVADDNGSQMTTTVEILKNGPLMVYGNLKVKDAQGNETTKSKVTAFCRCGASANKPYCDGSHIKIGFKDAE